MSDCGPGCTETLREIERFLDGELDSIVRVRVETHLADCFPCSRRAEFQRHLKVIVSRSCGGAEVPQAVADRIRAMIRELDPSE
jgi:mycothiol system anti-sigma-R factor